LCDARERACEADPDASRRSRSEVSKDVGENKGGFSAEFEATGETQLRLKRSTEKQRERERERERTFTCAKLAFRVALIERRERLSRDRSCPLPLSSRVVVLRATR